MVDDDDRVDALAAALGEARWRVDDMTRARMEARLRQAIPRIDPVAVRAVEPVELVDDRDRDRADDRGGRRRRSPVLVAAVVAALVASAAAAAVTWQLQRSSLSGNRTREAGDAGPGTGADRADRADRGAVDDHRVDEAPLEPSPVHPRPAPGPIRYDRPAPPAPPVSEDRTPPAPDDDDAALYRRAERAMAEHDRPLAARTLRDLTRRFPTSPLTAQAHYELARFAFADGDLDDARGALERAATADSDHALAEPIAYLRCRVDVAAAAIGVPACLGAFRAAFPRSSHDAEVLALLGAAHYDAGTCATATRLLDEYLDRYPRGPFAAGHPDRLARCAAAAATD